ncbi:hypothetical protein [Intrasporangium calvum]|uniref:Secreted protein n=1 Tax=Intrasporangium calvum (strain ATCC 23552 / DSM 43043 / JCM 3097 / NBRC 12989 / NCIMB 10167 / NRRL B-3866 / 7 KIP) TaxID=710696 RepID=E6SBG0_INTC7|nr:hypothetical protein [Intrasporangium calvum]ADU49488.1 hypothetical protein Intca_2997 [Intrasporangium calvum DSM 43043]
MRNMLKALAVVSLAGSGLLLAGPAQAADSAADYGQQVKVCTQTMGFDGMHNPGLHGGISGWDPSHTCPMG